MNKQFSIYLDLIRFIAAMLVFASHVPGHAGGYLWQLSGFGHEAVVVFFVLSGFVISYVVFDKNETAEKYVLSRLTRIYSVAVPAVVMTLVLFYLGEQINPDTFTSLNERLKEPVWTTFSAILFLNQSWVAYPMFSNLPYWSLGYEVLYYVFFGILIYAKGIKKIIMLLIIVLIMGPSIFLYLPIWLAGVFCFKSLKKHTPSIKTSMFLYILSIAGILLFSFEEIQQVINHFSHDIVGANFISLLLEPAYLFLSDYVLTIFATLHIFSSYHLIKNYTVFNEKFESLIRKLSSHTFSLYLYHMPILYFISAVIPFKYFPFTNFITSWVFVPLFIFYISRYTESKKEVYRSYFQSAFNKLSIRS